MRERLFRLSLLGRMAIAIVILAVGFLCVAFLGGLFGGMVTLMLGGWAGTLIGDWGRAGMSAVGSLPAISDVTPLSSRDGTILAAVGAIGICATPTERIPVPDPSQRVPGSVFVLAVRGTPTPAQSPWPDRPRRLRVRLQRFLTPDGRRRPISASGSSRSPSSTCFLQKPNSKSPAPSRPTRQRMLASNASNSWLVPIDCIPG